MPSCLIVTAYYQFPSKHSSTNYDKWIQNFLTTIDNPLVIFCDAQSEAKLRAWRSAFLNKTWIHVLPFELLYCYKVPWQKHWERDREKRIHNPSLYTIWNEKSYFVYRAIGRYPNYDFYMWCDAGCFRSEADLHLFKKEWPSQAFLTQAKQDKMYFLNIEDFKKEELVVLENGLSPSFEHVNRIGGTIFLGHKEMFILWIRVYYDFLQKYLECDYFAGKDQNILASIYVLHPEFFELIKPKPGAGDPWFYLQRYFLTG